MNFLPTKYLLFLTIIFSFNNIDAQKIDSVYRGKSFPGVLFDNPYANQKFNGTWVIKGWNGKHELKDSSYFDYWGPSVLDPSMDSVSSVQMVIPKYQDSLVMLDISNEDYSKIITIPGCSDCSFISYYDMRNDILYANNPANKNQTLIITRNPNGDALSVTLGNHINEKIYREKSFIFEKMDKYTNGSMKLKLPKKTKSLKLKDIDKLEFELRTGKVYGDSILSNNEYKISIFELSFGELFLGVL